MMNNSEEENKYLPKNNAIISDLSAGNIYIPESTVYIAMTSNSSEEYASRETARYVVPCAVNS